MAARCAAVLLLMQQGEQNKVVLRPERVFKDSLNPLNVPDVDLIKNYRLPRHMIVELCIKLKPILERQTGVNHVFPVPTQVLTGLGYLATGNFQNKNVIGVSQSSFIRILDSFITALSSMVHKYVRFPVGDQQFIANIKSEFQDVCRFPHVIGAIGCTHIPVKALPQEETVYTNHQGVATLNCQMVCSAKLLILHAVVKWPGSVPDSVIWQHSELKRRLSSGLLKEGWLLGDNSYPLEKSLMTPVRNPSSSSEEQYNLSLSRTRKCIEDCFVTLRRRFHCLFTKNGTVLHDVEKCKKIILSTIILHNMCICQDVPLPEGELLPPVTQIYISACDSQDDRKTVELRQSLIENVFRN